MTTLVQSLWKQIFSINFVWFWILVNFSVSMELDDSAEIIINLNNSTLENRTSTFYEIDNVNSSLSDSGILSIREFFDGFFDHSTPEVTTHLITTPKPSTSDHSIELTSFGEVEDTSVHPTTSTSPLTTTSITTTVSPNPTNILTISTINNNSTTTTTTTTSTSTTPVSSTTVATVRLYSNILNVKPEVPTLHKKPRIEPNNVSEMGEPEDTDNNLMRIVMHGTNMNSEELRMCNKSLIQIHFKQHSRRKVARTLKKELDTKFSKWNYRFSVVLSTTSRNTMGKSLHGVWLSISINDVHYFITATHNVIDSPKLREDQMDKLEYWAELHAISAHNMTGYRKYNKIASKLKFDLDRQYGFGNVWSVIIVKNRYLVKAKIFEDPAYHMEFTRLNGGNFIIFRGGQNIDVTSRHAREILPVGDDESSEHTNNHVNHYK